ncbi:MAG TPA: excinuclease ABC subunit UvrC [Candidatus Omnitrophota bacterium]|nr:excinuclease ABC subunit UvrC [Candidatus Omnitrophota bacterium]
MVKKEAIKDFPDSPGVYIMKDAIGQVIYVGKAVSLKKRVSNYFLKEQASIKTEVLMSYAEDLSFIEAASEYDALLLEDRLIKQYKPRFNIVAKDDKSFPYIKITHEDFPRVFIARRKKGETGFDYFGPYTSAKLLRRALAILRKSFPFCSCRKFPKKECLNCDLGLCLGPCTGKISKKEYAKIMRSFEDFLTKKDTDLIEELSRSMRDLVKAEKFEEAAKVRDQLEALSILISLKKIDAKKAFLVYSDFEKLGLKNEPERIECFDISNIGGGFSVGSMVSFYKGKPDKNNYRRFKVRMVEGIDDYAMMREVVRRRYERLVSENKPMPDLIVIDGGKGHLEAAQGILRELNLSIPIISIAKREELIYTVHNRFPVRLKTDSEALKMIQRARDEAHRFALKYHHLLRSKNAFN